MFCRVMFRRSTCFAGPQVLPRPTAFRSESSRRLYRRIVVEDTVPNGRARPRHSVPAVSRIYFRDTAPPLCPLPRSNLSRTASEPKLFHRSGKPRFLFVCNNRLERCGVSIVSSASLRKTFDRLSETGPARPYNATGHSLPPETRQSRSPARETGCRPGKFATLERESEQGVSENLDSRLRTVNHNSAITTLPQPEPDSRPGYDENAFRLCQPLLA